MKYLTILTIALTILSCSPSTKEAKTEEKDEHAGHTMPAAKTESKPKSPKQMAMANIGETHVHIEYSSPGKRGRVIFGGLVAYDEVWVTGAHRATSVNFPNAVEIDDTSIEAGKYAIFTIPGEEEWAIIINQNWDQHLVDDYDQALDVVRITVKPTTLDEVVESLTYGVTETGENEGIISISWDQTRVELPIKSN